ncbi:MAG: dihydrolipoamide acetyltransferase component of pyruvate dehydrogenase complex [Candidatus Hydrogenedentota bacterium]
MQEVLLPQLGQSVEEASIVAWIRKEGEAVKKGDPLFTVQTDKAEIECESTAEGVLRKILVQPDTLVPVMTVVALVGKVDEALPDLSKYGSTRTTPSAPATPSAESPAPVPVAVTQAPPALLPQTDKVPVSPRARRTAAEMKINPALVAGSGVEGRVMEADVKAFAESISAVKMTPTARRMALASGVDPRGLSGTGPGGKITKADVGAPKGGLGPAPERPAAGDVQRVPLTPMRKIIARRMAESLFSAPHYYVTIEVDMAACAQFRGALPFKVSYNDLLLRAVCRALEHHPMVNARWAGEAIEIVGDVNLGVAVALDAGLIVPVVKQVQRMSLQDIARESKALIDKARTNKLTPDDYSGSTFTISNLGVFGVDHFTAIINQPDSAILAVGQIKDTPVVIDGGIHVRPVMKLTMSSDHRVIDGSLAAQFMGTLKQILESADF